MIEHPFKKLIVRVHDELNEHRKQHGLKPLLFPEDRLLTMSEITEKFMENENAPLCSCGCGQPQWLHPRSNQYTGYARGHKPKGVVVPRTSRALGRPNSPVHIIDNREEFQTLIDSNSRLQGQVIDMQKTIDNLMNDCRKLTMIKMILEF